MTRKRGRIFTVPASEVMPKDSEKVAHAEYDYNQIRPGGSGAIWILRLLIPPESVAYSIHAKPTQEGQLDDRRVPEYTSVYVIWWRGRGFAPCRLLHPRLIRQIEFHPIFE
jgi:hypothetical protein